MAAAASMAAASSWRRHAAWHQRNLSVISSSDESISKHENWRLKQRRRSIMKKTRRNNIVSKIWRK